MSPAPTDDPAPLPWWHPLRKCVSPAELKVALEQGRLKRPCVFTNGVFDLLHRGHVTYLAEARQLGASLIVALNSDASARGLGKGPDRPLNNESDRACVVAALGSVDAVVLFETRTPLELIETLRPDIYVKGGDYDMGRLEEAHRVRSWGGLALALPYVEGCSSTALVRRVRSGPP